MGFPWGDGRPEDLALGALTMNPSVSTTVSRPAVRPSAGSLASRVASLAFGSAVYILFLATFTYVIGFVFGAVVPKHVDSGEAGPRTTALLVNGGFLALFALQHMIMARPAFKRRWTRIVPQQIERSVFVLAACAILIGMVWQWRPMPETIWHVEGPAAIALYVLAGLGWATVLVSTFLIDHFELFGLRQVWRYALGLPADAPQFRERSFYKLVRHPLMLGFLVAFWSTPHMSLGHLFFALMCTGYILVGTLVEERTLVALHGPTYLDYRRRVPGLLPIPRRAG